ncbi:MAG: hypothetical protein M1837_004928 [Sclerophora amabilis]|nr:MAG: hypothetical protein M1837_004928 [Sclerophora amabilis]
MLILSTGLWRWPATSRRRRRPSSIDPSPKEFVVASQAKDSTRWIDEASAGGQWNSSVYTVDDESAPLQVPRNKGHEAMVYLTYLIDRYDTLPEYIVFLHGERYQWHNDDPKYDTVSIVQRLRLDALRKRGYLNLRCTWNQGCPGELDLLSTPKDSDTRAETAAQYARSFKTLFPGRDLPDQVAVSCCSQFAVTRGKVHERPRTDYENYRTWLLDTPLEDKLSGRIMEYSWHLIFGMPPVHCPDEQTCYCETFGLCDLACTEHGCGRYVYPFGPDRGWWDRFKDSIGV